MPSLAPLQPENVAHGSEILIQAWLPGVGSPVTLGEIYELDYDEDQGSVAVPTVGSRITGFRQGRFKVAGSMKVYWIDSAVEAMLTGVQPAIAGVSNASLYHSARPFNRFNIRVTGLASSPGPITLINCMFEKAAVKWGEAALSDETINFVAEDVLGS